MSTKWEIRFENGKPFPWVVLEDGKPQARFIEQKMAEVCIVNLAKGKEK